MSPFICPHIKKRSKLCSFASKIELLRVGANLQTRKFPFFIGTRELGCSKSAHIPKYVIFVPTLFDGTSTRPLHIYPGLDTLLWTLKHTHTRRALPFALYFFSFFFLGKKKLSYSSLF